MITCILCPNGCELEAKMIQGHVEVSGHLCKRGIDFAKQELLNPMRVVCSTVKTNSKKNPRLPVKTSEAIEKDKITLIMAYINKIKVSLPIKLGDILGENVAGLGVNIIATASLSEDESDRI